MVFKEKNPSGVEGAAWALWWGRGAAPPEAVELATI